MKHYENMKQLCENYHRESQKTTKKSKVEARRALMEMIKFCKEVRKEILQTK